MTEEEHLELRAELDTDDTEENSISWEGYQKIIDNWRLGNPIKN